MYWLTIINNYIENHMSKSQKKVQFYEFDLESVGEFFNGLRDKDPMTVIFWLDAGMNPDIVGIRDEAAGKTALSYVISRWTDSPRDAEVLKLLLEHGANPNIMIDVTDAISGMVVNKTLLSWLVEQNNTDLVKTALECGANPNTINNPTEAPALHRRAIDGVIDSPQKTTIIGLLRNYGSVEPKNPVLSGGLLPKLEPVVGYSPDTYVNMTRAGAIVAKMIADHPLDDIQITAKIIAFKTMLARDYGGILNFAVRVDGVGTSLSDVIDGLLEGYEGRFAGYGINDIRKTVGTIIHISENNAELIGGLAAKLAEVNMCNFSKLIELLYVVQDTIIGGGQIAWHTKNIDEFQVVFDRVFNKLSKDVEDPELAFVQWLLDMYKGNNLKPEDRHPLTNKILGMFNEVFSEIVTASEVARGINGVLASYHFSDGLQQKVADLVQKLVQSNIGKHKFLTKWMELYNVSQSTALQQFFDQAKDVNEDEVKDFFDNLAYSTPYMNTFEFVGFQMIREAYVKVLNSKPYSYAKEFIKAVARLEFDNVVKKDVEKLAEVVSKFSNKEMLLASKEWQRLDIMIDSQKLEFITKTSLYTNDQISLLLTKAVPNAYVAPIIDLTADGNIWENILLQSIIGVTHDNKSSILIPINLNNVHWSGMIIKPKIGGGYQVIYNDPMGVALTARAGGEN